MKIRSTNSLLVLILVAAVSTWAGIEAFSPGLEYYTPPKGERNLEAFVQKHNSEGIAGAVEYVNRMKANQYTGLVDPADVQKALDMHESMPQNKKDIAFDWRSMGPDNIGGRTRAIWVDRDNNNIIYGGAVSGGFFKSTNFGASWKKTSTDLNSLIISSITQTENGDIYFGTGELNFTSAGAGALGTGFMGRGMWKSTDRGETFEFLEATEPTPLFGGNNRWDNVNILASVGNKVFAGTDRDLMVTEDGGQSFQVLQSFPVSGPGAFPVITDLKISPDGNTIFAVAQNSSISVARLYRSTDGGATFEEVGTNAPLDQVRISNGLRRLRIAIAPSNPDVIYATGVVGRELERAYKSTDRGETWSVIATGSSVFDLFGGQGEYNHTIAVDPYNENRLFVGGVDYYQWTQSQNWSMAAGLATLIGINNRNPFYIHADKHEIVFDTVAKPYIMYVGTDGGIYKSLDAQNNSLPTYSEITKGYVTTQFYSVAGATTGAAIGGTQDNGTIRVDGSGVGGLQGIKIKGGDGGDAAISRINPNIYIGESQFAAMERSQNKGTSFSNFFDRNIEPNPDDNPISGDNGNPFITPMHLWEDPNDTASTETISFIADKFYQVGEVITLRSPNGNRDFEYTFEEQVLKGEVVEIPDPVQSKFFIAISPSNNASVRGIWMTKQATNFTKTPTWFKISNLANARFAQRIEASKNGDKVFVSTSNGNLYRISGLRNTAMNRVMDSVARFSDTLFSLNFAQYGVKEDLIYSGNQAVTGIYIDPNDSNRMVMTLGNYGSFNNHVFLSDDILSANPTFTSVQANLPRMPVYSALISAEDSRKIILGTELGIYYTETATATGVTSWQPGNDGEMDVVPVFDLWQVLPINQEYNGPTLFIGTHGRGIFKSGALLTSIEEKDEEKPVVAKLQLFPNPASEYMNISFKSAGNGASTLRIFSMDGKQVETMNLTPEQVANSEVRINTGAYKPGTYFARLEGENFKTTAKFVVLK
ncbi:MAG: T9SS type A sorting domain-containing protein [Bacteroidia bacterium]